MKTPSQRNKIKQFPKTACFFPKYFLEFKHYRMLMGFNTNFLTMGLHHFVPVITSNTKKNPEPINKDTMQREKNT